ncbi:MAG: PASTA domain-containing protein [Candidatus Limnocylindrales bacterium]
MTLDDRVAIPGLVDHGTAAGPSLAPPDHEATVRRSGPRRAPDMIGLDALDAHAIARESDLRLSVTVWETPTGPWGLVVDQQPSPGVHVRRGSRVRIVVSGRPHLRLPDLRGLPLETAIDELCWLGFVPLVDARRPSGSVRAGHIISTRPAAGTLTAHGSVVALTVAKAAMGVPASSDQGWAEGAP